MEKLYEDIQYFSIFGSIIKNGLRDYYFLERNLEHLHKFVQKFMSIYCKNQLFFILHNHFSKTPTSDCLFYILFHLNNHTSFFVYSYLQRERERERERERGIR